MKQLGLRVWVGFQLAKMTVHCWAKGTIWYVEVRRYTWGKVNSLDWLEEREHGKRVRSKVRQTDLDCGQH